MKITTLITTASFAACFAAPVLADHNSKWGEGIALDPLNIHDTRIDTRASGETFTGGRLLEHPVTINPAQRMGRPDIIDVTSKSGSRR